MPCSYAARLQRPRTKLGFGHEVEAADPARLTAAEMPRKTYSPYACRCHELVVRMSL
jgi:hypothetical protein